MPSLPPEPQPCGELIFQKSCRCYSSQHGNHWTTSWCLEFYIKQLFSFII